MESFRNKQEYEEYYIDFDFTNLIEYPDEISSANVSAVDEAGADATSTIITTIKQNIESPNVFIWVKGGTTGKTYTITCQIITDNGEKYELEGTMAVTET